MTIASGRLAARAARRGARAAPADRPVLQVAGRGSADGRDRRDPVGHRLGRHAGAGGDQGRGRHHLRPGSRRRPSTHGMPRAAPSAAAASISSCRPSRSPANWRGSAATPTSVLDPDRRGGAEWKPARRTSFRKILALLRSAFGVDFTHYRETTDQAADPCAAWCSTPRTTWRTTSQQLESGPRRARGALPGHPHQRDQLLPRPRDLRGPQGERLSARSSRPRSPEHADPRLGRRDVPPARKPTPWRSPWWNSWTSSRSVPPIQIFATDLSETVLAGEGAAGVYPESIEAEVSPERLRRFFTKEDGNVPDQQVDSRHVRLRQAERGGATRPSPAWT